jgi:hypothetical protein
LFDHSRACVRTCLFSDPDKAQGSDLALKRRRQKLAVMAVEPSGNICRTSLRVANDVPSFRTWTTATGLPSTLPLQPDRSGDVSFEEDGYICCARASKCHVTRHWHGYSFLPGYRSLERIGWDRARNRNPIYWYDGPGAIEGR